MVRDFQINGETMVYVRGGDHMSGDAIAMTTELGLCLDEVKLIPRYIHRDIHVDDFGPDIPAEVLSMLAEVNIRMTLSHYDRRALKICTAESLGADREGRMPQGGIPLGGNNQLYASGCHYISMLLESAQLDDPWRFPHCYLSMHPFEYPLGTTYSKVVLNWRAIPYKTLNISGEVVSSGAILWDRNEDFTMIPSSDEI